MSIGIPGGSVHEGVCISAGIMAVGGACEQRKENRVHGGAKCVISEGAD
jgi:hypothetical protein